MSKSRAQRIGNGLSYTAPWATWGHDHALESLGDDHDKRCFDAVVRRRYGMRLKADLLLIRDAAWRIARMLAGGLFAIVRSAWLLVIWLPLTAFAVLVFGLGKFAAIKGWSETEREADGFGIAAVVIAVAMVAGGIYGALT